MVECVCVCVTHIRTYAELPRKKERGVKKDTGKVICLFTLFLQTQQLVDANEMHQTHRMPASRRNDFSAIK